MGGGVDWFNEFHSPFLYTSIYVVLLLFIALLCHAVGMMISRITLFNKIVYGQF